MSDSNRRNQSNDRNTNDRNTTDRNTNDRNTNDRDEGYRATSRGYDGGFSRGRENSAGNRNESGDLMSSRSNSSMGGSDAFGRDDDFDRGTYSNERGQGEAYDNRDMNGASTQKSGDKGSNS